MTILITGNSHTGALKHGMTALNLPSEEVKVFALGTGVEERSPFAERDGDEVVMSSPRYAENLTLATGTNRIAKDQLWVFVMGTHNLRILRGDFWCDAAPSSLNLPGKRPISEAVLDAIIKSDQEHIRDFLSAAQDVGVRFLVASCPPVRRDYLVDQKGLAADLVHHVDGQATGAFRQWLKERDIPFISPPDATLDQDGFLGHKFIQARTAKGTADLHHANGAYGKLMMAKILQAARQTFPKAVQAA